MPTYTKTNSSGDVLLANTMPKAEYMYGCTPTSVGMILGYYDLYGYHGTSLSNIIQGTVALESRGTDGDAYDMDAFDTVLGKAIATTGYVYRFHSRNGTATTPEEELPYTFVGNTTELNTSEWDCLADYLGTGQYWRGNANLSTTVTYCTLNDLYTRNYSDGTLTYGSITRTIPYRTTSMLYGLDLYVKSRGYSLDYNLTGTFEVDTAGGSFTFADYMNEIDAGRPVLISIKGHSMVGYGYNESTREIIFDDCYQAGQRMTWGGTYSYSGENRAIQTITTIVFSVGGTTPSSDKVKPTVSNIKASTTAPTNKNVTVTATFSDNVALASSLYRIGDSGSWTAYPSQGVTVTQNATVYFKAVDTSGNESSVASCKITNIDKTPPAKPTAKASTTASTTKPVSVTATFSKDTDKKEYSLDNKTWKTYSAAVKFTSNGTVYFRGTDKAGNVSDVTSYKVSNISSSGSGPGYDTSACDNGRNDWLVDKSNATIRNSDSNLVVTPLTNANTEIWLDTKGSVNRNGKHNYAGYGDAADFAKITLATAAKLSFTVSALDASNFTLYSLTSSYNKKGQTVYKLKKLQSVTLKKAKGALEYSAETKELLLEAGNTYYISVESTNAKKGGAAYYNVMLDSDSVFYNSPDSKSTDDWDDVKTRGAAGHVGACGTLTSATSLVYTDWVGFGDAVDYRKFSLASAARICLEVDAMDPVKISICKLESKNTKKGVTYSLKTIQSATAKANDGAYSVAAKPVMLEKGDYYICVESTTAKKGGNAKYSLSLAKDTPQQTVFYNKGNNSDDWDKEILKTWGAAGLSADIGRIDNKSQFVVILSDWVGYGDEIDYRKFTLNNNVVSSFIVSGSDAMKFEIYRLVGKTDKKGVTTYSLKTLQSVTAKKTKGGDQYLASTSPLKLEAGSYYLSVKSTNAKKGGSSDYSVAINSMEVSASAADALSMPENTAVADALSMPETDALSGAGLNLRDELIFGQYTADVLSNGSASSLADFDAGLGLENSGLLA